MRKSEKFALLAGTIGLIADIITLTLFLQQRLGSNSTGVTPSLGLKVFVVFTGIYSWLIISWMLVRRHWKKLPNKNTEREKFSFWSEARKDLCRRAAFTVYGIGIVILPFLLLFPGNEVHADFVGSVLGGCVLIGLIGGLISCAITLLMPILYDDMFGL